MDDLENDFALGPGNKSMVKACEPEPVSLGLGFSQGGILDLIMIQ